MISGGSKHFVGNHWIFLQIRPSYDVWKAIETAGNQW